MIKKLMVVDDEPDILTTIRVLFEHNGYEVVTASNGKECIEELEKGFKGVIILDIMMPGIDGWDTVKQIIDKGLWKDIVIIMLTAVEQPSEKMESVKEYVIDYVTKPFDSDELVDIVQKYSSYLNK
ncbi:MAG: response regulator [Endomicrobiales bacterium]|nr:response regulator [Endomicrobiales bacterium]